MENIKNEILINQEVVDSAVNDICVSLRMLLEHKSNLGFSSIKFTFEPEFYQATIEEIEEALLLENYSHKKFGNYAIVSVTLSKGLFALNPEKLLAEFEFKEDL